MARSRAVVDQKLKQKALAAMETIRDANICVRLQAIVSCSENQEIVVAKIFGMNRTTLWRWIQRFKAEGVEGLFDRPKGHYPAKLTEEHKKQIRGWLKEGKNHRGKAVHWTLEKLAGEIEDVFGISVGKTPLWLTIRRLGFRQKVPRPAHASADPAAQEAFKKNR